MYAEIQGQYIEQANSLRKKRDASSRNGIAAKCFFVHRGEKMLAKRKETTAGDAAMQPRDV